MTMKTTEITRRYHETWNGRDADALVAAFTKDGTFAIPTRIPELAEKLLPILSKDYGQPCRTFLSNCSMLVKSSLVWSLTTDWYAALTPQEQMEVNLQDVLSQFGELPLFRSKEIRFV